MRVVKAFVWDSRGQDLIEYALLISFIALVVASAVSGVGRTLYDVFYEELAQNLFGS